MNIALGFFTPRFSFHACSGALIQDFYTANGPNHEPAQLSWLKGQTVSLVTLTVGGNNAAFDRVMLYCAFTDIFEAHIPCKSVWSGLVDTDISLMANNNTPYSLERLYKAVKIAAGSSAKVLVLGYPRFFPKSPPLLCKTGVAENFFTRADMNWIDSEIETLDGVIQSAAASAGVTYVPGYDAFSGHELCTRDPYLNQAIASRHGGIIAGSFHPNANGQFALAQLVVPYG